MYREAQLSPEFSQFLEKNRNHNGTTNFENQISTGYKRPADKSVGYVEGGMQAVTKEQRVDRNYESVERASSELSEAADLVRRNTVIRIHIKFNVIHVNIQAILHDSNGGTTSPRHTNSPSSNEHYEAHSHSDHDEIRDENRDTDASASGTATDGFVDPNSLAAMERSQSPPPPIDDQREASPIPVDLEVGMYEDIGAPIEPKIHELRIAQQFIKCLENATLDNSKLDDWVRERLRNPLTGTVDDMLDPILRLSLDIYLAVGNASQETYNSVRNALMRLQPSQAYSIL